MNFIVVAGQTGSRNENSELAILQIQLFSTKMKSTAEFPIISWAKIAERPNGVGEYKYALFLIIFVIE